MKSIIFYTSMIMTLLVSNPVFSEILWSTGGNGSATIISANAEDEITYDSDSDSGWYFRYTDTAGYFDWAYGVTPHANCFIMDLETGKSAFAMSYTPVEAQVYGMSKEENYAYVELEDVNGSVIDGPGKAITDRGFYKYFPAYTGVWVYSGGLVVASIEEGSSARAYAATYSAGAAYMLEPE